MGLFKKIAILAIVILFTFIIGSLLIKRKQIYEMKESFRGKSIQEGMSSSNPNYKIITSEIKKIQIDENKYPNIFHSLSSNMQNYSLGNFIIKSSYNSAYSGGYISDEMVNYVLSRGCRMLDFEVYHLSIGGPPNAYIGYNPTNSFSPQISNNNLDIPTLYTMLKSSIAYAFKNSGTYTVQNTEDPLFIHIRMKVDPKKEAELLDIIIQNINALKTDSSYEDYIYNRQEITMRTKIKFLLKKTIFVINNSPIVQSKIDDGTIDNQFFLRLGNQTINTFELLNESQINNNTKYPTPKNSYEVNINTFRMIAPSNNGLTTNIDMYKSIKNLGCNFTMMMYYYTDKQLLITEDIFTTYKGGIIPMTYALSYIDKYPVIQNNVI